MITNRALTLGCATLISTAVLARDANKDFATFMKQMLPKVQNAFNTRNYRFFEGITTPDFTEVHFGKTVSRKDSMAEMKSSMQMMSKSKFNLKLLSTAATGNTATAMTYGTGAMTIKPDPKMDNKAHTYTMEMWGKETWVRSGTGWKIKKLEDAKPMKMTMDGRPFDPSKMGG